MQTDNQVVRAAFEKAYPMPFACGWNSMTHEYECIWPEHGGEESVEAAIAQHNDRYKVWRASRETMVVELPDSPGQYYNGAPVAAVSDPMQCWRDGYAQARARVEAQGLKVAP